MKPSPFLALRTIKQLVHDHGNDYSLASQAVLDHTYDDDVVTGASTYAQAECLRDQINDLFAKSGFQLRKWSTSRPELLSNFTPDIVLISTLFFKSDASNSTFCKVLGLQCDQTKDLFLISIYVCKQQCKNARCNLKSPHI